MFYRILAVEYLPGGDAILTPILDTTGNPFPKQVPWHKRVYATLRKHYLAAIAGIAAFTGLATNIDKLCHLFPAPNNPKPIIPVVPSPDTTPKASEVVIPVAVIVPGTSSTYDPHVINMSVPQAALEKRDFTVGHFRDGVVGAMLANGAVNSTEFEIMGFDDNSWCDTSSTLKDSMSRNARFVVVERSLQRMNNDVSVYWSVARSKFGL